MSVRDTVERTARNWDQIRVRVGAEDRLFSSLDEHHQAAFVMDWVVRAAYEDPDAAQVGCLICGMLLRDVGYHQHTEAEIAARETRVVRPDQIQPDPVPTMLEAVARWLEKRCELMKVQGMLSNDVEARRRDFQEGTQSAYFATVVRNIPIQHIREIVAEI